MIRLITLFAAATYLNFTAQTFSWSAQEQFPSKSSGTGLLYDTDQNTIVCGEYNNYGKPHVLGSFLMRYKRDGTQMWKIELDHKMYMNISFDRVNKKILASSAYFNLTAGGYYINKYDLTGTEVQSIAVLPMVNGVMANKIHSIAADNSGGYVIAGTYQKNFTIQQFTFADPPSGEERFFLARFDSQDVCLWVVISTSGSASARICVDRNNDILVAGKPGGTFSIGGFTSPSSPGNYESFLCKVDQNGTVKWGTSVGSNSSGSRDIKSICTDNNDNVYAIGTFDKDIILPCGSISVPANSYGDIFLLKLNSAGQCQWLNRIGGSKSDSPYGLSFDPVNGGIYIAGNFTEQCTVSNYNLVSAQSSTSTGVPDAFIAKYDDKGVAQWAMTLGADSCGLARGGAIVANEQGDIFSSGQFRCRVAFGNHSQTTAGTDFFITSINVDKVTNLQSLQLNRDIRFFPNPTTGFVKAHMIRTNMKVDVTVFNVIGEKVMESQRWSLDMKSELILDFSAIPKGIYFIQCTDGESTLYYKQIVN